MIRLLGIAGSLRLRSINEAVLHAAAEVLPEGVLMEIGSIKGIPLYDGDVEAAEGIPKSANDLKDRIVAADGLLLVTPEYNNSIPGVFKNAIDWLSRPQEDIPRVFGNRPVGIIGASPGPFGTANSQTAWLPVLRALGMQPWLKETLYVSGAFQLVDDAGRLTDEGTRLQLQDYMEGFAAFVGRAI